MVRVFRPWVALAVFVAIAAVGLAQTEPVRLAIGSAPGLGNHLVDGAGRTLYVLTEEEGGVVTCTDECVAQWQPVLTEGRPAFAPGLIPGFVGTVERPDGSLQATFRNWPLYYFAGDEQPGDATGQGLNDSWFVLSTTGDVVTAAVASEAGSVEVEAEPVDTEVMTVGQELYMQICVACHAANGQGGQGGPSLVDRDIMADTRRIVDQIVFGGGDMPSFGHMYDDEQVAAIATYTRNAWGNAYGPVSPEDVIR